MSNYASLSSNNVVARKCSSAPLRVFQKLGLINVQKHLLNISLASSSLAPTACEHAASAATHWHDKFPWPSLGDPTSTFQDRILLIPWPSPLILVTALP